MIDSEDVNEILQCPFCGYIARHKGPSGAMYCGPHLLSDGTYNAAQRMDVVADITDGAQEVQDD